jgi:hypothetical protein
MTRKSIHAIRAASGVMADPARNGPVHRAAHGWTWGCAPHILNTMKKLSTTLSDELHRRFKVACNLQGCDMSEALRKLVKDYVDETEQRKLIVVPRQTRE